jgi:integrase
VGDILKLKALITEYTINNRRSLKRVDDSVNHLTAFLGEHTKAAHVDETRVGEYIADRQKEEKAANGTITKARAANGTINRELTALKRAFHLAAISKRVADVPHISMLKEAAPRSGFVDRDQLDAILLHLPEPVRVVVFVAYLTGWRIASEVLTRQWKHVDFKAGFLRLEPGETKNGEGRMFKLFPELREVLERQRQYTDDVERERGQIVPWIFHRNGKPITSFRKSWDRACTKAGYPGLIPHDMRRSAVRNLERARRAARNGDEYGRPPDRERLSTLRRRERERLDLGFGEAGGVPRDRARSVQGRPDEAVKNQGSLTSRQSLRQNALGAVPPEGVALSGSACSTWR